MKYLAILALLASSVQAQTVSIPAQTACTTVPQQTICVTLPARTLPVVAGTTPPPPICVSPQVLVNGVCTTAVPPSPPTGVAWGYFGGQWNWAGDFTGNGTIVNYHHATTSGLHGHTQDIQLTTSGAGVAWPYWLPYFAANYQLPNPGYTKLLLSIKPTVTGQTFGIHMERVGDNPLPSIELMNYGPASVAGVWASYVIPLKDLGTLGDATLYKFLLQDHSATSTGWEMDEVGFL